MIPFFGILAISAAAALSFGTQASAQVTNGEIHAQQMHGDWMSLFVTNSKDQRFRSVTRSTQNSGVHTFVDFYPPGCNVSIQFAVNLNSPLEGSTGAVSVAIDTRVDSGHLYRMNGSFSGEMGDEAAIFTISPSPEMWRLIADMEVGYLLRAKVALPSGLSDTYAFPLAGFAKSFARTKDACERTQQHSQNKKPQGSIRERRL